MSNAASARLPDPVIAVHGTLGAARDSIQCLRSGNFDTQLLSVLSRTMVSPDAASQSGWDELYGFWSDVPSPSAPSRARIPDIGELIACGPFGVALVEKLRNPEPRKARRALRNVLVSMGMPKKSALNCETYVKASCVIIIVNGTDSEISRALTILELEFNSRKNQRSCAAG
jgi:hypothetical protein